MNRDSLLIGTQVLCENIYKLELYSLPSIFATLFVNIVSSMKHLRLNDKYSILLHKRLGHISKQGIVRLIKDGILPNLDFSYLDTYVDCIKGKLIAKIRNAKADRCTNLLGLFIQIFVGYSPLLLWVATNIS